jgi:hypothetical protein
MVPVAFMIPEYKIDTMGCPESGELLQFPLDEVHLSIDDITGEDDEIRVQFQDSLDLRADRFNTGAGPEVHVAQLDDA